MHAENHESLIFGYLVGKHRCEHTLEGGGPMPGFGGKGPVGGGGCMEKGRGGPWACVEGGGRDGGKPWAGAWG